MAEVAEAVNDVQPVEKETDKKAAVDIEEKKADKKEKDTNPKENGRAETNEKEAETNGSTETTEVTPGTKRKSGAGDAPDGTPTEGSTPEKKAKISEEDKEKESTNGETEVGSEGAAATPNILVLLKGTELTSEDFRKKKTVKANLRIRCERSGRERTRSCQCFGHVKTVAIT